MSYNLTTPSNNSTHHSYIITSPSVASSNLGWYQDGRLHAGGMGNADSVHFNLDEGTIFQDVQGNMYWSTAVPPVLTPVASLGFSQGTPQAQMTESPPGVPIQNAGPSAAPGGSAINPSVAQGNWTYPPPMQPPQAQYVYYTLPSHQRGPAFAVGQGTVPMSYSFQQMPPAAPIYPHGMGQAPYATQVVQSRRIIPLPARAIHNGAPTLSTPPLVSHVPVSHPMSANVPGSQATSSNQKPAAKPKRKRRASKPKKCQRCGTMYQGEITESHFRNGICNVHKRKRFGPERQAQNASAAPEVTDLGTPLPYTVQSITTPPLITGASIDLMFKTGGNPCFGMEVKYFFLGWLFVPFKNDGQKIFVYRDSDTCRIETFPRLWDTAKPSSWAKDASQIPDREIYGSWAKLSYEEREKLYISQIAPMRKAHQEEALASPQPSLSVVSTPSALSNPEDIPPKNSPTIEPQPPSPMDDGPALQAQRTIENGVISSLPNTCDSRPFSAPDPGAPPPSNPLPQERWPSVAAEDAYEAQFEGWAYPNVDDLSMTLLADSLGIDDLIWPATSDPAVPVTPPIAPSRLPVATPRAVPAPTSDDLSAVSARFQAGTATTADIEKLIEALGDAGRDIILGLENI